MKYLSLRRLQLIHFIVPAIIIAAFAIGSSDLGAQTNRRRRTSTPIPAPSPTPATSEPLIISRADEFPDENSQAVPPDPNEVRPGAEASSIGTLEDLGNRIKNLEAARNVRPVDPDEKQKRLLLNLDILTRAEQRAEGLRKQVFDMIEKENTVKTKIDSLEYGLRPEEIDRSTAFIGSLRPEEIRASRKKSMEAEKTNLQSLLTQIQRTRTTLEASLLRSEELVEKLRLKFEKEIDMALEPDPQDQNQN
jgi:hypothetical protein